MPSECRGQSFGFLPKSLSVPMDPDVMEVSCATEASREFMNMLLLTSRFNRDTLSAFNNQK